MDRVLADGSMSLFVHFLNLKENKQTNSQTTVQKIYFILDFWVRFILYSHLATLNTVQDR